MIIGNKKYNIIYADPGWEFNDRNTGGSFSSGSAQQYRVMNYKDICKLPVPEICAENCVLVMWWVGAMPKEAIEVAEAWGFTIKTMTGFTWVKLTKWDKLHFGMGHYTRQGAENALIAVKGKIQRVNASIRQVVMAKVGKHSEKPAEVRDKIVELFGDLPKIELFSRHRVSGWDAWGDEVPSILRQPIVLEKKG